MDNFGTITPTSTLTYALLNALYKQHVALQFLTMKVTLLSNAKEPDGFFNFIFHSNIQIFGLDKIIPFIVIVIRCALLIANDTDVSVQTWLICWETLVCTKHVRDSYSGSCVLPNALEKHRFMNGFLLTEFLKIYEGAHWNILYCRIFFSITSSKFIG